MLIAERARCAISIVTPRSFGGPSPHGVSQEMLPDHSVGAVWVPGDCSSRAFVRASRGAAGRTNDIGASEWGRELRHPVSARQALGEISHPRAVASCQHVDVDSLDDLRDAAVEWTEGGRGQPLVDAVVNALVAGADTPALVLLAGATRALADEEAAEFAPRMFDDLGLVVHERHSEAAYLAAARLEARRFLEKGGSGRYLAGRMYLLYVNAGYLGTERLGRLRRLLRHAPRRRHRRQRARP